jgi:glycosyltransferase involved in cell wall biosynthesis
MSVVAEAAMLVRESTEARPLRVLFAPDYRAGVPYQADLAQAIKAEGVAVEFLSHYRRGLPLFRGSRDFGRLDAIHLHWPEAYFRQGLGTKLKYCVDLKLATWRRPLFLTAHNLYPHNRTDEPWMTGVLRRTIHAAQAIFAHSKAACELYVDRLGARPKQMRIIPFGDLAHSMGAPIPRDEAARRVGVRLDRPICLMFGAISAYKGIEGVLEAWKQVEMPARLIVAGAARDAAYLASLKALAEGTDAIEIRAGWLEPEDLRAWLSVADVTVLNYQQILSSGAAGLARSFGVPILFPKRLAGVDLGEPHSSVFRFEDLQLDFPAMLGAAIGRGLDYEAAAEWRQFTSWENVARQTSAVYREFV